MKRTFVLIVSFLLLYPPLFAQKRYTGQSIEEILALPENEIDLGIACLVLAKDAYPNINIPFFDYALNYMADRINTLMQGNTDPEARIAIMNTYLYRAGWWNDSLTFTYDLDDLEAKKKENQFLNAYLATKKGSCVTMPMLYLVLADRLGWPIRAVLCPQHFFLRYVDDELEKNNIEATLGGSYLSDERYISDTATPQKPIKNGVYMRTLSKKEYLGVLLLNNARHFYEREDSLAKAIYYTQLAISLDSTLSAGHWNLGNFYFLVAKRLEREMSTQAQFAYQTYEIELMAMRNAAAPPSPTTPQNPLQGIRGVPEVSQPSLWPPNMKPPSLFPQVSTPPAQPTNPLVQSNPYLAQRQADLQYELMTLQTKYAPALQEAMARSQWHYAKAEELGIVLKLPDEFYIKQAKSIETFKRTGEY